VVRGFGAPRQRRWIEVPDLKNGATEQSKETENTSYFDLKKTIVFFVLSVGFVAPFLRSGYLRNLRALAGQ
jgi:hypothetical protein